MFTKLRFIQRSRWLGKFIKPEIYPEAFFAYFHKLPETIQIDWFRDDNMIVGKVKADGKEFMTQGTNADDFIQNVNDSLITVYDIPHDYFEVIRQTRSYHPNAEEYQKLTDLSVNQSTLGFEKYDRALKFA